MKKILLDENKKYYKGNLHCHSTNSDGKFTPEELKKLYKEKGYSILAITDHEHLNDNSYLDDESFLTVTSSEIAIKQFPNQSTLKNYDMKVCHLNLYAKDQHNTLNVCYGKLYDHFSSEEKKKTIKFKDGEYERIYSGDGINDIIKIATENGFFVSYNHPCWSLENYGDYSKYNGLWGIEIYNTSCIVGGLYENNVNVFDDFLRDDKKIFATCGDDNHRQVDMFGSFVMVNAEKLEYSCIIDSLLKGGFYISQGPKIYALWVSDNKVYVKCSAAKQISYSTHGRRTDTIMAEENGFITEATFQIRETDKYFRIDITDKTNNHALTQAYYCEDFDDGNSAAE